MAQPPAPRVPLDRTHPPPQINFTPPHMGPLHPQSSPPTVHSPKLSPGTLDFKCWPNHLPSRAPLDRAPHHLTFTLPCPQYVPSIQKQAPPLRVHRNRAPAVRISDFGPTTFPPRAPPPQNNFTPPPAGHIYPKMSLPRYAFTETEPQLLRFRFLAQPPPPLRAARSRTSTTSNRL